ncbi:hypothetical protein L596_003340 [Steinernema carpocapsae]|uniref:Transglutaminase-like domain-containing protein n=1 Tax=Steinernema carpocapsae TaxID=34508 RepID=A0A4U8UT91_STECR|nr:hypothetical protein L596_003340 [Steinernema carpocapsae]
MVDHKASDVDVIGVDLLCEWNAQKHSTERYQWQDKSKIVARRGFPVQVRLKTARTFEPLNHALYIEMVIDNDNTHDRPESHKKLRLETEDVFTDAKREWSAKLDRIEGQRLFATITIPVNAAVGFWEIRVHTGTWSAYKQIVDERISTFNKSRRGDSCGIYVIFNVLNNGDTVFMENKDQRDLLLNRTQEYTYSGFAKGSTGYGYSASSWEHSQFDENTMKATMTIFKKLVQPAEIQATLPILKRDNIVEVSRKLSYGINAFLLYGKWEGSFKEGTHPAEWNGSALIMAEFLRTGLRVRYAQCFTFASIFVTIMRCLGVPSRTVTCIRSAHDTDHSLTIDLITINGKRADGQSESIWNFHVWTEIWCRRIDLPVGFDGWQVVDATPQEESDGVYQCGPMPVEAIKTGRLGDIAYDAWFIYGEVNADIVMWFYKAGEQEPYDFAVNMNDAGRALLTVNAPGIIEPLNITTNYKEPESSENERSVHMQALREVRIAEREDKFRRLYANGYTPPIEDVVLAIPDIERINYGSKILLSVNLENKTSMNRTVDLTACLSAEDHKGKVVFQVKEYKMTQHLVTNQKEKLTFTVSSSDYIRQIVENQIMSFAVSALVRETNQMTHVEDKFQITGMAISFEKVPSRAAVQEVLPVAFYFRNPLNVPLRNVELFLHSGLHSKPMKIKRFPSSVEANGKVRIRCKVRAVTQGERSILATLNCGQLHAMTIARSILVAPN